uniref:Histidine--tRNA ligase n=1 Tax=Candidatus Kentrum sp. SD TaxID=2126332 RepID=A0A450Y9Q1_9GAMM|nr:MAG: histidyl-tRNA synthetase [Candidatus Kentron sp. SD]VFK44335.1 MAG: histidyl-tRNA synthetase [Candidatus Kentron sp. SD]VFK79312.1 MAG: histidyl-tRNA synthetase [Candidatus Kentron sp. SD]
MNTKKIQAIRGMGDILPFDTPYWQYVEDTARALFSAYGYGEIRLPIVEKSELFTRSIGEVTDIVEKEMYTFMDRSGDNLSLRPEGTAGCVRAGIEHHLLRNQIQRLWYQGPMFRHERPQKGRYRQFHQIGVEAFGITNPSIDAELLIMSDRLWRRLGISGLRLEINSLCAGEVRDGYRNELIAYFSAHGDRLDEASRRRLHTNPLRILDTKNPDLWPIVQGAPQISDFWDDETRAHFEELLSILDALGIAYVVNPYLVRGLDYYTGTVFEWTTDRLGAQAAVCAGGRFDTLVSDMGEPSTPGIGYAIGLERLVDLLRTGGVAPPESMPHAYLVAVGEGVARDGQLLAEQLRDRFPKLRLIVDLDAKGFKAKMKRADRSNARVALILGEDELATGKISVKHLREQVPQRTLARLELDDYLDALLFSQ